MSDDKKKVEEKKAAEDKAVHERLLAEKTAAEKKAAAEKLKAAEVKAAAEAQKHHLEGKLKSYVVTTLSGTTTGNWWLNRQQNSANFPTPQTQPGACLQPCSPGFYPFIITDPLPK